MHSVFYGKSGVTRQGRAEEEAGEGARQQRRTGDGREQPSRGQGNEWIRGGGEAGARVKQGELS
jgi:hypothetical protein